MGFFKKYVYTIHGNDAAPMLPLIDATKTYGFAFTCIPVPLRVDKVINGELTTFITPDKNIRVELSGKLYSLNIIKLIEEVVYLLIHWSKNIVKSKFNRDLPRERLASWLSKTLHAKIIAPTLSEDAGDFIKNYFETVLISYFKNSSLNEALKSYLNYIVERCMKRISSNRIKVSVEQVYVDYPMLEEEIPEEDYLNPEVKGNTIPVDVYLNNKLKTMSFRPFLVYQDLLETAEYTLKRIEESELITPMDLIEKHIIIFDDGKLQGEVELSELIDKIIF